MLSITPPYKRQIACGNPMLRLMAISSIGKEDSSTSLLLTVKSTSGACSLTPAVWVPETDNAWQELGEEDKVTLELQLRGPVLFP